MIPYHQWEGVQLLMYICKSFCKEQACNLLKYLEKHPNCQIAFKADKEKQLPQRFWCKNCGRILDSIVSIFIILNWQLPHQITCLYHGSTIDSSTFPNDVYAFIDNIPDDDELYDDDMNIQYWFSSFGHTTEILDQEQPDNTEGLPINDDNFPCDINLQYVINYWLSIAGDDQLTISSYAVTLLQECLDLFYANIIEEANEESRRRAGEDNRCLVPSLIGGILSSNKYLKFISNYGLRKPEPLIQFFCLWETNLLQRDL